ncbi:pyroglutamyl-peptidase I [Tepidibacillus decaturensis]|uniref:Pyrrolidone-carboxylate peptidase n=1 Tax=Tepidibacillus decaturensis TaxID=1413211 RepID=A0A135L3Y8_9BACI|nr:pyroglutamyl-peptidase I [Tepidibacillus decaturensis]KXG43583.1 peptidase C15 [Tepidibacillus decaturensis]
MKKLLLTGFEPFLDNPINPTEEIVKELKGKEINQYLVIGQVLPVDFAEAAKVLFRVFDEERPDVVISLGLAAGRNRITPERIAINCNDGAADNKGVIMQDQPIEQEGPAAYFSTLPIRRIVDMLVAEGYPAEISNSAGTYLCNHVMYSMLHKIAKEGLSTRSGFVHVPASHDLALKNRSLPSWHHHDLVKAIELIINVL